MQMTVAVLEKYPNSMHVTCMHFPPQNFMLEHYTTIHTQLKHSNDDMPADTGTMNSDLP